MNVSVKQPPELEKRKLTSLQQRLHNFSTGAQGETRAVAFLKKKQYSILDTNVRFGLHEVDIIAVQDNQPQEIFLSNSQILKYPQKTNYTRGAVLVFCEVKTRTTSFFGDPSQAVTQKKLASMQFVAREYLKRHRWAGEYRFDVLAVLPEEIEHFENVTWW